jgi:hypothetical protein
MYGKPGYWKRLLNEILAAGREQGEYEHKAFCFQDWEHEIKSLRNWFAAKEVAEGHGIIHSLKIPAYMDEYDGIVSVYDAITGNILMSTTPEAWERAPRARYIMLPAPEVIGEPVIVGGP